MRKYRLSDKLTLLPLLAALALPAQAQLEREPARPWSTLRADGLVPVDGVGRNSINDVQARGDSLWAAPRLVLTTDGGQTWQQADIDSVRSGRASIFALELEPGSIWAALGTSTQQDLGGETQTIQEAVGFVVSRDGGRSWTFHPPGLDAPTDTVVVYGENRLAAIPTPVPELAATFDLDYDPATGTLWTANWYGGLRRSDDFGRTFDRVVLPPDTLTYITPDSTYDFQIGPDVRSTARSNNYFAFAVLVDEAGTVWAGTAGGINRSTDGGVSWRRFSFDDRPTELVGDWIIAVEEQPLPGRNPVWFATRPDGDTDGERYGVAVTRDGGETFEQMLVGERISNFAFRGETVYAAGDNGLFISDDGGFTWRTIRDFETANAADRLAFDARAISVATTDAAVWVGTSQGLARRAFGSELWEVFRADVPVRPATPTAEVPRVDTYAYPNPFSPGADRLVRIRYVLEASGAARVRVFDFAMNLVRELRGDTRSAGEHEIAWDGLDDDGLRIANGPYLYAVEAGGETVWGKILVVE